MSMNPSEMARKEEEIRAAREMIEEIKPEIEAMMAERTAKADRVILGIEKTAAQMMLQEGGSVCGTVVFSIGIDLLRDMGIDAAREMLLGDLTRRIDHLLRNVPAEMVDGA